MLDDLSGALILVTGANGFVGGRVSRRLVDEGAEARALVRRAGDAAILEGPGIDEWVGGFTETEDARRAVEGVDAVVHCAATAGDDLEEVRRVNRGGTRTIASAALDEGVTAFVHISTGSVYDRGGSDEVTEDTPRVDDGAPYALTKAEAEQEVESASDGGLPATILRPPAVLGWGPTSTWGQQIPEALVEGAMPFTRRRETPFAWVHVDDLAGAVVHVLTEPGAEGSAFNVVGGHVTWGRYIDDIASITGASPPELDDGSDLDSTYSGERVRELGWEPERTYEDAMEEIRRHFGD